MPERDSYRKERSSSADAERRLTCRTVAVPLGPRLSPLPVALAVLLITQAAAAPPPGYVETTLPNGLEVSIVPRPDDPVVATQVWYHVGSANEDPGSRGLAHLLEHLMFGETAHYAKRDYWEWHHRFGGDNNAFTSPDETVYVSEIAPEAHAPVLDMEADRMTGLVIEPGNLENEKRIVTEEHRLVTENEPEARMLVAAQHAFLGSHPYAIDPTGTKEDVAAATVESCRAFYDAYYHPNNAHLVIVGPVDPTATLAEVESAFGGLPRGGQTPADVPPLLGWRFPPEVDLREDLPPVEIAAAGFLLPPAGGPDEAALEVLVQLLSGGAANPFREELVSRRRKAIEAGTMALDLRRGGVVVFYSLSLPYRRKASAFRFMDETRATLSRLDWLTDESLAAAKRALRRKEAERAYFPVEMADAVGRARWWDGSPARAFDHETRIAGVTRDAVAAAWRKYVADPAPVRLYLRPEHVPLYVRLFGWLYPLVSR